MSHVLTDDKKAGHKSGATASPARAWRAVAWFGAVITVIGLAEAATYLYPWGFGSREWEFGATAQLLGSLPLPTMGLAAMLAAAYALGSRRGLYGMAVLLSVLGLLALGLLALFWLVVPIALKAPAAGQPVIRQTIMRATIVGFGFGVLYLGAAIASLLRVIRSRS